MARQATQTGERGEVLLPGAARRAERLHEEIVRRPVMFIDELAVKLETSTRTIMRGIRAGTFFIPELPKVDHRHRWSREVVYLAIGTATRSSHAETVRRSFTLRKHGSQAK